MDLGVDPLEFGHHPGGLGVELCKSFRLRLNRCILSDGVRILSRRMRGLCLDRALVRGDLRMLLHHGIHGTQRIARHLWRMSFALFIAASSIFMARQQIFPAFMRKTGMLMVLSFLPLALMIFWLIRVRFANVKAKTRLVVGTAERSLFTETG